MVGGKRALFFYWFVYDLCGQSPNCILPKWAVALRFVLFPLDTFYHLMRSESGYDVMSNTWRIKGLVISEDFILRYLARPGARFEIVDVDAKTGLLTVRDLGRVPPQGGNVHGAF